MGTTAAFRLENITIHLGSPQVEILRGISVDVLDGETLALVGKSGSGKSTLVGAMSGLIAPSGGVIHRAEGQHGSLRTSTVFQDANLFPWLNAVDNVALSLRLRNHPSRLTKKSERRARALEIMNILGIGEFADRRAHELSGGQQQRVSIARAVAAEPDVLLLDEPFSALDVATRASLQEWLVEHRRESGCWEVVIGHVVRLPRQPPPGVLQRHCRLLAVRGRRRQPR